MTPSYELTFAVESFMDDQIDALSSMCDVMGSEGHGRCEIDMLVGADDPAEAQSTARRMLAHVGLLDHVRTS